MNRSRDALQRMTENGLSAIPIMDGESDKILGAVTMGDVVELMLGEGRG